ncbi:MAG: tetratricopeptide repeat-containing glycosyltransferase family protein [Planctomycetota bacterium]|nr:tetratricopeptide repeat-containing glycosyltransferase family protein [Planctomycetota bacterium]
MSSATLPEIDTLFPRVDEKFVLQEWDIAHDMLREMEDHFGEHPETQKRFGIVHSWKQELKEAFACFEKAKELGGNSDELGNLAYMSLNGCDSPEVFETFFPRLKGIFSPEGFVLALSSVIERAFNHEKWDNVENWCQKGIEWAPDAPHLFHLSTQLMLQRHQPNAVVALLERAQKLDPQKSVADMIGQIKKHLAAERQDHGEHPIELQVNLDDGRYYFSIPGTVDQFFYSLPVLRQILRESDLEQGVLITSPTCEPLQELMAAQPYVAEFVIDTETCYLPHTGIQPYTVLPDRPNCFNLGFRPFLMHTQSTGYSETLAILSKIPFVDQEEQHLLVTPEPTHKFIGQPYAVVCPDSLLPRLKPGTFWKQLVTDVLKRFPVVFIGWEAAKYSSDWSFGESENFIGKLGMSEAAGILKHAACFFGPTTSIYHIARNVGTRPFAFSDIPVPPQSILAPDEVFTSQQLAEVMVLFHQMPVGA